MDIIPDITDRELLDRTAAGDASAYEQLFGRYRPQLYASLLQKSGDELITQEILQETFVKAYFNLSRFNPEYTFGQWIHTIAKNLFIDFTRRRRSGTQLISIDQARHEQHPPCDTPNPEERIISDQLSRQLEALTAQLPEHYRTMIELRFVKEYSYEEIAEKLDMPLGTVKTQIHRARERLCTLITQMKLL